MKKIIIISLITLLGHQLTAQDPFFSQFYNSPLTLNPALTGISFGNIRVSAHYRNHLATIEPFQTYSFSYDMSLFEKNKSNNFGGLGFVVVNDASGLGLKNLKAMLSLSYHIAFGKEKNHFISLGFQGGADQTNHSFGSLATQSQWVSGSGVDRNINNGENLLGDNILLADIQAGLMWYSFINERLMLFAGGAAFHILEPEKTFTSANSKISRRYVSHVGGKIGIGSKLGLIPNVVFMQQGNLNLIHSGMSFEYNLSSDDETKALTVGAWIKNLDAIIVATGIEYKNFNIGLSYDMVISDLKNATRQGGLEISLTYLFRKSISPNIELKSNPSPRL